MQVVNAIVPEVIENSFKMRPAYCRQPLKFDFAITAILKLENRGHSYPEFLDICACWKDL